MSVDLTPFKAKIEAAMQYSGSICADPRSEFMDALRKAGFKPDREIILGRIIRIDGQEDKRGQKSGWYVYYEFPDSYGEGYAIGVASFGDWKTGFECLDWCSKNSKYVTPEDRAYINNSRSIIKKNYDEETDRLNKERAIHAFDKWNKSSALSNHPYLTRKKIVPAPGMRIDKDGSIIVPMIDASKSISCLQNIWDNGKKKFMYGCKAKGSYFFIDGETDIVYIAEGAATSISVWMATGKKTYAALSSSNIYETASIAKGHHPDSRLIIAGDDDINTTGNPGRTKTEQAASGLGIECVFPDGGVKDFNDMHVASGLDSVRMLLNMENRPYKAKKKSSISFGRPAGVLGEIIDYYNATSGNDQPGFAAQSALCVCAAVCSRNYKTQFESRSNMFFINIGLSGTGKEHAKTVVEKILDASGLDKLIVGEGYTSSTAVISALEQSPRHVCIIDEFGKYLKAARSNSNGMMAAANATLTKAWGSAGGKLRHMNYANIDKKKNTFAPVVNPAVTLMAMTTPDDFFENIGIAEIKDGYLNRFLIHISDATRDVYKYKEAMPVPESIISWVKCIEARHGNKSDDPTQEPKMQVIGYTAQAMEIQKAFDQERVSLANSLDTYRISDLVMRMNEISGRVALIHALSRDPMTNEITEQDVSWAVSYVRQCFDLLVSRSKKHMSASEFESDKLKCLDELRRIGEHGISESEMQKRKPFSQYKNKDLKEIMESLVKGELAFTGVRKTGGKGRPVNVYIAKE